MKTEMKLDTSKPVQTRDGREAGIYSTGNEGEDKIHGWCKNNDGIRHLMGWQENGRYLELRDSDADLVNVPEEPKLVPYTFETFPMWAVWVREKGSTDERERIGDCTTSGVFISQNGTPDTYRYFFKELEIAGTDGIWHPAGQEESK